MTIQAKLKIEKVAVSKLIPYAGNAKEHPDWQIDQIANSIEQFGMNDPIGVWTNESGGLEIIEGHGRLLAAKKLGLKEVPIIRLDHLDNESRRAYVHVHNQLTMNTGFDLDILNSEMEHISGFDWNTLGFEIGEKLEDLGEIEEDEIPEIVETRCQLGNIWKLGEHRLICGDSTKPETIEKLIGGGERADLLLTDPPYNVDYAAKNKYLNTVAPGNRIQTPIKNDKFENTASFTSFLEDAFAAAAEYTKDGGAFYVWYASNMVWSFIQACEANEMRIHQTLVWVKNNMVLGLMDYQPKYEPCLYGWKKGNSHYFAPTRKETSVFDDTKPVEKMTKDELLAYIKELTGGVETDVLRYDKPARSELHPTMKPVALFAHLIRNSSKPGDTVLDIFAGSGTTLVACEEMGRKAYLVEYDPHYCDVILERYERLTGDKPVLISED